MLFSHVTIGSNDLERSKRFYDALFQVIGGEGVVDPSGRLIYIKDGQFFLITKPVNGQEATPGNGGTIGFYFTSADQVNKWHQVAVDNGGKSVEDPPGIREGGGKKMYLAYVRDPDGNKLCGYCAVE